MNETGSFTRWLERMRQEDRMLCARTWDEVSARVGGPAYGLAVSRGLPRQEALDFVEELLVKLVLIVGKFDRTRGRARAWVRTIAERMLCDHFRRIERRPRRAALTPDEQSLVLAAAVGPDDADVVERAEERERMRTQFQDAVADLKRERPRAGEVFDLYALQGLPARETAERLGIDINSVYARKWEALEFLRTRLSAEEEDA